MKVRYLLPLVALFSLQGCIVHRTIKEVPAPKSKKSSLSSKECHPSQYWDGEKCRHKGKGKGARKHDD
jgi:hypothetical protein